LQVILNIPTSTANRHGRRLDDPCVREKLHLNHGVIELPAEQQSAWFLVLDEKHARYALEMKLATRSVALEAEERALPPGSCEREQGGRAEVVRFLDLFDPYKLLCLA
jgi:hypothetical protein